MAWREADPEGGGAVQVVNLPPSALRNDGVVVAEAAEAQGSTSQ